MTAYNTAALESDPSAELRYTVPSTASGTPNTAPGISDIANRSVDEDSATGAISFTIGDDTTAVENLVVNGGSSDPALIPDGNILFGGSGANRTVSITPALNQSGIATITVSVSDGTLTTQDTFVLTVNAVNDPPAISDIVNQTVNEDNSTGPISFTVGDIDSPSSTLMITGSSSNPGLIESSAIVFGGSGTNQIVTVTPLTNQFGTATITISVSDGGLITTDTFLLTVNPVNDAPVVRTF